MDYFTGQSTPMTKRELLCTILKGLKAEPSADVVIMSITNAKLLGMPASVFKREIVVLPDTFPNDYVIVGVK